MQKISLICITSFTLGFSHHSYGQELPLISRQTEFIFACSQLAYNPFLTNFLSDKNTFNINVYNLYGINQLNGIELNSNFHFGQMGFGFAIFGSSLYNEKFYSLRKGLSLKPNIQLSTEIALIQSNSIGAKSYIPLARSACLIRRPSYQWIQLCQISNRRNTFSYTSIGLFQFEPQFMAGASVQLGSKMSTELAMLFIKKQSKFGIAFNPIRHQLQVLIAITCKNLALNFYLWNHPKLGPSTGASLTLIQS